MHAQAFLSNKKNVKQPSLFLHEIFKFLSYIMD